MVNKQTYKHIRLRKYIKNVATNLRKYVTIDYKSIVEKFEKLGNNNIYIYIYNIQKQCFVNCCRKQSST